MSVCLIKSNCYSFIYSSLKKVLVRRETRPSLSGENDIIRVNETYAGENNTILQESTGPVKRMKFEII